MGMSEDYDSPAAMAFYILVVLVPAILLISGVGLIISKLMGGVDWSWWWVTSPLWILPLVGVSWVLWRYFRHFWSQLWRSIGGL